MRKLAYAVVCVFIVHFVLKMIVLLSSNEDVDEGFVINQEGIGLRLTAMEYWKCSKAGITLPFVDKKEPDCKFVIAESLPEQGDSSRSTFIRYFISFAVIDDVTTRSFQAGIRSTPSWRSTGPRGSSTSGCTPKTLYLPHTRWLKLVSSFSPLLVPTTPRFDRLLQNCTTTYLPQQITNK